MSLLVRATPRAHVLFVPLKRSSRESFAATPRRYISADSDAKVINIGGIRKTLQTPLHPELVPRLIELTSHQSVLRTLKWMLQKDLLGQDMFLIGPPGHFRRTVCMKYLSLTQREVEYVALSRDTTESDLKQRREIRGGSAHYVDQAAVRAATLGRVLVLEGIEKAERNVLPVLNNLMENREMQLEDGRFLLNPTKYDSLLLDHSTEELAELRLVRVSEHFRVVALGLPVPRYIGNPLDPPLRSRFQAYDLRPSAVPFKETLMALEELAPAVTPKALCDLLSFAMTVNSPETSELNLPDFPIDNLNRAVRVLGGVPSLPPQEAVARLYPHQLVVPNDARKPVADALSTFDLDAPAETELRVTEVESGDQPHTAHVWLTAAGQEHKIQVPAGDQLGSESITSDRPCVLTPYHSRLLAQLVASHAVHDICLVGPRGCGKSAIVRHLADMLGYRTEPVVLYQDMTSRDLLQQRSTHANGDTVWLTAPLVKAALQGRLAVLDGLHRVHGGTLNVLHRLVHDRELQLYDGTRLLRHDRYDDVMSELGLAPDQMTERGVLRIHPAFRLVALAEPPVLGSGKGQWLTPEVMSMFMFHSMRPMTLKEESDVLQEICGELGEPIREVVRFSHALRSAEDHTLQSLAPSLSTRQLIRVGRRMKAFPHESPHAAIYKACLARFLPPLARQALDGALQRMKIAPPPAAAEQSRVCEVRDGILTIGGTSAPVFRPKDRAKVPETLFFDIDQHTAVLEAILEDFTLGENLLLVGNQGVGKNKLIDRFLYLMSRPREYIQLHRDTTVQTLTVQPTVQDGRIVFEDSALVRAVRSGHVLVIDEADKAPTHVTCILKTLSEDGEMTLSDGRRIQRAAAGRGAAAASDDVITMHPDFQMVVLANRPGFPFLGNDFFAALGDLFSCHAIDNPSEHSERMLLKQYGPDVPDELLDKVVSSFAELRQLSDEGLISYPYSTREAVNIVKHLQKYPEDGLATVVRNVFDFDSYSAETQDSLAQVLHKHGIPIGASARNLQLAKEYPLPSVERSGGWRQAADGAVSRLLRLPAETRPLEFRGPYRYQGRDMAIERTEARGTAFGELRCHWALPLDETEIISDVTVVRGDSPSDDQLLVGAVNPAGLYSVPLQRGSTTRYWPLYHQLPADGYRSRLQLAPLGGPLACRLVAHEEHLNGLVMLDTSTGDMWRLSSSNLFQTATEKIRRSFNTQHEHFWRMNSERAHENVVVLFEPGGSRLQALDLTEGTTSAFTLPLKVATVSLSAPRHWLVQEHGGDGRRFVLRPSEDLSEMVLSPVTEGGGERLGSVRRCSVEDTPSTVLSAALGETLSAPSRLLTAGHAHAAVLVGFPELEASEHELYRWPRQEAEQPPVIGGREAPPPSDHRHTTVVQPETGQVVRAVTRADLPIEVRSDLPKSPSVSAYLEVTDLPSGTVKYLPVQSTPLFVAGHGAGGVVTVDTRGVVRLWETATEQLTRSAAHWARLVGDDSRPVQVTYERESGKDVEAPKHGKVDATNAPHVGGNTWAGGTGGRDTAGLGGKGGPYRLDAGHDVTQVPDWEKEAVPEHVQKAAREMNRAAYQERLRQIRMSEHDAAMYDQMSGNVRKQVQSLRVLLSSLQAKGKERQWLKHQTSGELDDAKLIEGITGERTIYKRRGEQEPELGTPQEKPKRLKLVTDVSGSMYRFNGYDGRLDRMLEAALLVMEAFEGYEQKFRYDIVGHSGEDYRVEFVRSDRPPTDNKQRLQVLKTMHAHSQFCLSGDRTVEATRHAISSIAAEESDEAFVIVLSDANLERYGIRPEEFRRVLTSNPDVNTSAIFLGSLGDQADRLSEQLPSGRSFVCLDLKKIPQILQQIFRSGMLS
ncbi:von Willebrand factor A domain-containing protein 8-like isoform X2 [Amphibalanus amphitrite]|uniref:von Willebrand factor A domain-containing protein 8-like isoform X2 n=1 Tax=Amphibalanus amphitrite TaxID=1232801 RepID=UPI001C901B8D|nr:von Willebrand factor A domain-containing protein 8-like isoform X2 [Amphibalanus amphitrite]